MGIESKVHQTMTRALVHPMERNCVDSIRLRTEEEEEADIIQLARGKGEGGGCCKKYEFEEAERGREEE